MATGLQVTWDLVTEHMTSADLEKLARTNSSFREYYLRNERYFYRRLFRRDFPCLSTYKDRMIFMEAYAAETPRSKEYHSLRETLGIPYLAGSWGLDAEVISQFPRVRRLQAHPTIRRMRMLVREARAIEKAGVYELEDLRIKDLRELSLEFPGIAAMMKDDKAVEIISRYLFLVKFPVLGKTKHFYQFLMAKNFKSRPGVESICFEHNYIHCTTFTSPDNVNQKLSQIQRTENYLEIMQLFSSIWKCMYNAPSQRVARMLKRVLTPSVVNTLRGFNSRARLSLRGVDRERWDYWYESIMAKFETVDLLTLAGDDKILRILF
ncbi:hypothetical protein HK102_007595 [Quaeritorhiza haematococci]|nr:hypothetical protein HK102_007595 [Quaeritorhiza haematococci]